MGITRRQLTDEDDDLGARHEERERKEPRTGHDHGKGSGRRLLRDPLPGWPGLLLLPSVLRRWSPAAAAWIRWTARLPTKLRSRQAPAASVRGPVPSKLPGVPEPGAPRVPQPGSAPELRWVPSAAAARAAALPPSAQRPNRLPGTRAAERRGSASSGIPNKVKQRFGLDFERQQRRTCAHTHILIFQYTPSSFPKKK